MRSEQQLLELIEKTEPDRSRYLKGLFEYVPDRVVEELIYEKVQKGKYILRAGTPSDMVYMILSGKIMGVDHQRMGRVYYFMDFTKEDIVERFVRGDHARTSEGNGLGLAIVSAYAKALGGEFEIKIDCDQFKACLEFGA